jgi:hypothetical protein
MRASCRWLPLSLYQSDFRFGIKILLVAFGVVFGMLQSKG